VRDVVEQSPLAIHQQFQARGGDVKIAPKVRQFIAPCPTLSAMRTSRSPCAVAHKTTDLVCLASEFYVCCPAQVDAPAQSRRQFDDVGVSNMSTIIYKVIKHDGGWTS
jgi:hypothetical protein